MNRLTALRATLYIGAAYYVEGILGFVWVGTLVWLYPKNENKKGS
jgi:hypothetical protein